MFLTQLLHFITLNYPTNLALIEITIANLLNSMFVRDFPKKNNIRTLFGFEFCDRKHVNA